MKREYQARRDAGLDVSWSSGTAVKRDAAAIADGAIRMRGEVIDPYRACVGLAGAAASRRAAIFEKSEVRRVRAGRKRVEVKTAAGTIAAQAVVIASGAPIDDLRALRRHLAPVQDYAVEAGITANNAGVRVFRAREALRKRVVRWCGSCAERGCIDCTCGEPGSSGCSHESDS